MQTGIYKTKINDISVHKDKNEKSYKFLGSMKSFLILMKFLGLGYQYFIVTASYEVNFYDANKNFHRCNMLRSNYDICISEILFYNCLMKYFIICNIIRKMEILTFINHVKNSNPTCQKKLLFNGY